MFTNIAWATDGPEHADRALDYATQLARGEGATLHMTAAASTHVAEQISEVADSIGADLIVVGTRGHSALLGAVIGSATQRLLHLTHCPVLAVPPSWTVAVADDAASVPDAVNPAG